MKTEINEQLTWKTTHSSEKMVHDFGNDYKIIVDKNLNIAFKMKGFEVRDSFSIIGMKLDTYMQILVNFAKSITQ